MSLKCILTGKNEDLDAKLADKVDQTDFQQWANSTSDYILGVDSTLNQHRYNENNPHAVSFGQLPGFSKNVYTLTATNWDDLSDTSGNYRYRLGGFIGKSDYLIWISPNCDESINTDFQNMLKEWGRCQVVASNIQEDYLLFYAQKKPTIDLKVNIMCVMEMRGLG